MSSSQMVEIYQGTEQQKNSLAEFCLDWSLSEFWPYEEFLVSLRIPGTFLLYQKEDDVWQALAIGRASHEQLELFYIHVRKSSRKQGRARQVLEAFCSHVSHFPTVERILLEVRPDNLPAIALYEQLGFRQAGIRKRYYKNGDDALIYIRQLNRSAD